MALSLGQQLSELKNRPSPLRTPSPLSQSQPGAFTPPRKEESDTNWLQVAIGVAQVVTGAVTGNPALIASGTTTAAGGF